MEGDFVMSSPPRRRAAAAAVLFGSPAGGPPVSPSLWEDLGGPHISSPSVPPEDGLGSLVFYERPPK